MARCVRRAFLFGEDSVTGQNYDHRKQWIVDKVAELSDVFAIDVCAYAVMSNHYHLVLYVDQDGCQSWSDDDVIERWYRLFKGHVLVDRYLSGEVDKPLKIQVLIDEWRQRLMDISWFMRVLNEQIARMANEEDGCKGRFWEGRFKSQALLDEAAVLTCMTYVDLNPVRAGMAESPELSDYTSIQQRLQSLAVRKAGRPKKSTDAKPVQLKAFKRHSNDKVPDVPFLQLETDYLELVDWTGRAILENKIGYIPDKIPPILTRLGLSPQYWLETLPNLEQHFSHGMGSEDKLKQMAERFNRQWLQGVRSARQLFAVSTSVVD